MNVKALIEHVEILWSLLKRRGGWFWYPKAGIEINVREKNRFGQLIFSFIPPNLTLPTGGLVLALDSSPPEILLAPHEGLKSSQNLEGLQGVDEMTFFLEQLLSEIAFSMKRILSSPIRSQLMGGESLDFDLGKTVPSKEEADKLGEEWEKWYEESRILITGLYLALREKLKTRSKNRAGEVHFRAGEEFAEGWMVAITPFEDRPLFFKEKGEELEEHSFSAFLEEVTNPPLPYEIRACKEGFVALLKEVER